MNGRKYICCVLTVREEFIQANPAMVQDLVNQVLGAGVWLDQQPENREKAVQIAAGRKFFNQDPKIIRFVMENPTDRVTYGDLRMIRAEFEELMQLSMAAGTIKHPIPYETYVDDTLRAERARRRHLLVKPHDDACRSRLLAAVGLPAVVLTALPRAADRERSRPASSTRRAQAPDFPCAVPTARSSRSAIFAARSCCWDSATPLARMSVRPRLPSSRRHAASSGSRRIAGQWSTSRLIRSATPPTA